MDTKEANQERTMGRAVQYGAVVRMEAGVEIAAKIGGVMQKISDTHFHPQSWKHVQEMDTFLAS